MRWPIGSFLLTVLAGAVGAVAWSQLAEPAVWTVRGGQLQMDQVAVAVTFGVSVTFALVGLAGGAVLGFGLGVLAPRVQWSLVVLAVAGGVIAMLVAWQLGLRLGPPDPSTVSGLSDGDTVPDHLALDLPAAFFAWPIAAVAGLLPGVWLNPRARAEAREHEQKMAAWSASASDRSHDPFGQSEQIGR